MAIHSRPSPSNMQAASHRRAWSGFSCVFGTRFSWPIVTPQFDHPSFHWDPRAHMHTGFLGPFSASLRQIPQILGLLDVSTPRVTPGSHLFSHPHTTPILLPSPESPLPPLSTSSSQIQTNLSTAGRAPQRLHPTSLSYPCPPPHLWQPVATSGLLFLHPTGGGRLSHRAKS